MPIPVYTVKNIKSFEGREGLGFNASLYRDEKSIGMVIDSGNGGCYDYNRLDKGEYDILMAHVKKNVPKWYIEWDKSYHEHYDPDIFIGKLITDVEINKKNEKI